MAMLVLILRKMLNNRWLVGSLFLGLVITVSLVSSIPTYTSSILQKLLTKELEQYQINNERFPGEFSYSISFSDENDKDRKAEALETLENYDDQLTHSPEIPILADVSILSTDPLKITHKDIDNYDSSSEKYGRITSMSDLEDHIEITDGRLPSAEADGDIYEVLVPENALEEREMVLDTVFTAGEGDRQVSVKPVGTFAAKSENDPYWISPPSRYSEHFLLPEALFREDFLNGEDDWLANARFYTGYDYYALKGSNIGSILNLENDIRAFASESINSGMLIVSFPIKDILASYTSQSSQLTTMLWSLNVPILIMLAIYLFMVSRLIIDRQLNEIAVLRSRGAKRLQILLIYLIESSLLGALALIIGPYVGLFFVKVLGASNGFLNFVQRSALEVNVSQESFLYALWAVLACIVMIMIPVMQATSQNIVSHKRESARMTGTAVWHKFFLDIVLLLLAWYGWYSYQKRQQELLTISGDAGALSIDPFLFFVPAMFIIGFGLFCLRIYPWLMRGIYYLGKKYWSLSLYSTLLQVSRSSRQYQFLMLFLVMTIAIGVFSASAARTINNNLEEQVRYENGADVAMQVKWDSNESTVAAGPNPGEGGEGGAETFQEPAAVTYAEPPFSPVTKLRGVEHATKVFQKENVTAEAKGKSNYSAQLMGIEPKEFGETAWFQSALLPHHWYSYLNLLAKEPSSVLISDTLASQLGVTEGDYLSLQWNTSQQAEFVIYGIIDYWPAFNPLKQGDDEQDPSLIVANLPYIQNMMGLEPYKVWLDLDPDAPREPFYEDIQEQNIPVLAMDDVYPKLLELKNSAFLLGLNGTLTLGFLISILITFIGFLLYWVLTLKSRILQYGIYRAIGIPLNQLVGILTWEQLLTSGMACILGIAIGGLTSQLFVPLFQLSFDAREQVPPFRVIFDVSDELKIYGFIVFMLVIGLSILMILLKRIRVHQAIKLGED
jgi:putative ABC transport system permease protein